MKPQGTFKPEAIEQLYAAYAEKHGSEMCYDDHAQSFAEAYDFMTCERPDGSRYGTAGQCRKGKPVKSETRATSDVVKGLQDRASRGDRDAMAKLMEMRAAGKIGKESGFAPGQKARNEAQEVANVKAGKSPVADVKPQTRNAAGLTKEEYEKQMAAMQAKAAPKAKSKKASPKGAGEALDALATRANRAKATGTYVNKSTLEKMIKLADETGRKIKYERMPNGNFNVYVQKG